MLMLPQGVPVGTHLRAQLALVAGVDHVLCLHVLDEVALLPLVAAHRAVPVPLPVNRLRLPLDLAQDLLLQGVRGGGSRV